MVQGFELDCVICAIWFTDLLQAASLTALCFITKIDYSKFILQKLQGAPAPLAPGLLYL